jgi:TatD DNase family protein
MLTDSHAHLDFPDFAADFDAVLARAEAACVRRIITIGTSLESSRQAVAMAERDARIWAVIGIHPNSATEAGEGDVDELRELAHSSRRVAAIGETGLDYYWLPSATAKRKGEPHDTPELAARDAAIIPRQAEIFRRQLDLAVELNLNVVIHQRSAWDDTLAVLAPYTGRLKGVFHCFGESPERAETVYAMGHLVSFTGIVTFKNAPSAQASAAHAPAGRFMVETDSPFLAPNPHRGQRCEPAYVRQVAEQVASLRREPLEELAAATEATVDSFFRMR